MKLLLDIDGVMIPARLWQPYELGTDGFGMFSHEAVSALNKILKSCLTTEIILTTSHKHSFSLNEWKNIFNNRNILTSKINRLTTNSLKHSRVEEIQNWLENNVNERFIIIDDDKQLNTFDIDFKEKHLILTEPTIGLTDADATNAIKKLKNL